jgi:hypothetical protein
VTWQRMLSNIHQIPSLRVDATHYTHTHSALDEGINKKIQALNDKCMNGCAVPLFMNAQKAAAQLLVRKQLRSAPLIEAKCCWVIIDISPNRGSRLDLRSAPINEQVNTRDKT